MRSNLAHFLAILAVAATTLGYSRAFLLPSTQESFASIWTKILQNPPDSLEVSVGSRVELQCEAVGNPPPQIYWISGNEPERQIQELTARAQEASNTVPTEWDGVSHISSTYVIDCVRAEDQGLKYCVSVSDNAVAQSTPTVLLVDTTKTTECKSESQPTITLHSPWRFALQENTIILPCRVVGQPSPYLFWLDNQGNTVSTATHKRHTVLPNGDLQIIDLKWADLGDYICKVQSGNTEKSVSTFLYPARDLKKDLQKISYKKTTKHILALIAQRGIPPFAG